MPKRLYPQTYASITASGMVLFALFAHSGFPLAIISGVGLLLVLLAIFHSTAGCRFSSFAASFRLSDLERKTFLVDGAVIGALFGIAYRSYYHSTFIPYSLGLLAPVVALIGMSEEIVYRGFIQKKLKTMGVVAAVSLATASHVLYKCSIFILPSEGTPFNFAPLIVWTFVGGIVYGIVTELADNVVPAAIGHALFDVLVYGDLLEAPWWVF